MIRSIKKLLVANRGEIAIRIFRACSEIGIETIAVYTYEDRYSLHRYKADEAYQIGADDDPLKPYLNIDEIIHLAKKVGADAIHPGYGFLSENDQFVKACEDHGIIFVGPNSEIMYKLGNKIAAKIVARENNIPIIESNREILKDTSVAEREAQRIGYPVMIKAAAGGGGRGMRVVRNADELRARFDEARGEARNAFGDDTVFIEKFIDDPKHLEVQIVADHFGNVVHLFERDCSVQRRFQKVVEIAPALTVSRDARERLYHYAVQIATAVGYQNICTVEFLLDKEENIYFIEVNPRIQVEHTVTEMITGVDLVKTQILIAQGYPLSDPRLKLDDQSRIYYNGYAIQCRITTEDPSNEFKPDYGTILAYRSAAGFGIRLDGGSIGPGIRISPFFDSMLVKVSAWGLSFEETCDRMYRTLIEFRIRGVRTNIPFLENVVRHPIFREGRATVNFIKDHPELLQFVKRRDRATRILRYIADVVVNGNPDVKIRDDKKVFIKPRIPAYDRYGDFPDGAKQKLDTLGPEKFARWVMDQPKVMFTDCTMRDAHQSLLATRMRTYDIMRIAESWAKHHSNMFSMEVWGGATFDVALRFLHEDPWDRLRQMRRAMPNTLLQMLIRGANAVGYTAYPDNLIERFIIEAAREGIDVFRIFDSLNWTEGMKLSIETVRDKTGALAEACICYSGDILDPKRNKYSLTYYVELAKELERMGAHILAIKDMAGLLKPYAADVLIRALKDNIGIPIHLHTHDTSSVQAATYVKAIEAGVDVVDVALSALSGTTSQPNFNSIVEMLRHTEHQVDVDMTSLNAFSNYWEAVRDIYYPFETDLKAGTAEVYNHEIPGGQYSNMRPQAISLGLGEKWEEIKQTYHDVNMLFGDIIKVTPSSKVVGDLAQYLVANNMTAADVLMKGETMSFPESVEGFFMGHLGQPYGGFPEKLQKVIIKNKTPLTDRPGKHLPPVDFDKEFEAFKQQFDANLSITDFLSYKFYPKVFTDYFENQQKWGQVSVIPSEIFFFGMKPNEEAIIEIAQGKSIIVRLLSVSQADKDGNRKVFFELNGQARTITVQDRSLNVKRVQNRKADASKPGELASPLPGMLSKVLVKPGDTIKKSQPLCIIEAMKMETTVTAVQDGVVKEIILGVKTIVESGDLLMILG
ncbi:pyruvate carboxylase [bacterium]|nr:pyruvate carboxylase [bacterium]NUN46919.1 pyruvate carboxylase [bacterium]